MNSEGSFQYQIVLCSSLHFFSSSIAATQMHSLSINFRVLICYTCHFQGGSSFFVYFGFLCLQVSSVSNFCPDMRCGKGGRLFRLTCSVVLWRVRKPANKYHWHVGKCLQCVDHAGFATSHGRVYFLCPHCSGSRVLCKGTVPSGPCFLCTSQV